MYSRGNKMDFLLKGIFALAIMVSASTENVKHLCNGYLPPNDLKIGVNDKFASGGLTKEQFISVLREAKQAYSQTFETLGRPLVILTAWDSEDVNAMAYVEDGQSVVAFYGGLARHPMTTMDSYRLVVCHELGHHIGGAPSVSFLTRMAAEGQADYYGAVKCMKRLLKGQENIAILEDEKTPLLALQTCQAVYETKEEQAICVRTQMAAVTAGSLIASLTGAQATRLETPSELIVTKTIRGYPSAQCRTDTQAMGAVCNKPGGLVIDSSTEESSSLCLQGIDEIGFRPNCWYKPRNLTAVKNL
jgi:hypothetical protein